MSGTRPIVDQVGPAEAYQILESDPESALIDVRTKAEWAYVGIPDLSGIGRPFWPIEWVSFPAMTRNADFLDELAECVAGSVPRQMLFICRSGVRSMAAAQAVAEFHAKQGMRAHCINVAEGFEGDPDERGHRGCKGGWKAQGLPWRQS